MPNHLIPALLASTNVADSMAPKTILSFYLRKTMYPTAAVTSSKHPVTAHSVALVD